jgi:hypothetical protein
MEDKIFANAELVRTIARGKLDVVVQYDEDGVRWLDAYIEGQRQRGDEEVKRRLPSTLGSFLGECIRHTYGGQWIQDPQHGWMVRINEKLSVFPFDKVAKQLANGEGDSALGLFTAIASLLAGAPPRVKTVAAEAPRRPWWKFWKALKVL